MNITLNGQAHQTEARTIEELLRELEMPSVGIAVAQNSSIVRRAEHCGTLIAENDYIEIIRAVQGG